MMADAKSKLCSIQILLMIFEDSKLRDSKLRDPSWFFLDYHYRFISSNDPCQTMSDSYINMGAEDLVWIQRHYRVRIITFRLFQTNPIDDSQIRMIVVCLSVMRCSGIRTIWHHSISERTIRSDVYRIIWHHSISERTIRSDVYRIIWYHMYTVSVML
jgi:hypothetical protein